MKMLHVVGMKPFKRPNDAQPRCGLLEHAAVIRSLRNIKRTRACHPSAQLFCSAGQRSVIAPRRLTENHKHTQKIRYAHLRELRSLVCICATHASHAAALKHARDDDRTEQQ